MKKTFSYRKGLKESPTLQKDEFDAVTENKIWDVVTKFFEGGNQDFGSSYSRIEELEEHRQKVTNSMRKIHSELLEKPLDRFTGIYDSHPRPKSIGRKLINEWSYKLNDDSYKQYRSFFFDSSYNDKLDFIDLLVDDQSSEIIQQLTNEFNDVFREQCVGYRLIKGQITDLDSEEEKQSVEKAVQHSPHIEKAIDHLYDRKNPDYENSIKESISAVEQICKEIASKSNATLSDCINKVESATQLHPAFKIALEKLYAYTSDEDGIRHGTTNDMKASFEDAKFMLVICSAFCNYLLEKKVRLDS